MKISDLIAMCVRNLTRRKFRTFLTVVGVVIGTCAIVVMISIGIGMSASYDEMIQSMGDLSMIDVYGWGSQEVQLNDETLAQIAAMPGVETVTPFVYSGYTINIELYAGKKERYMYNGDIIGVYPEALEKLGYTMLEGDFLPAADGKKVRLVFGEQVAYWFTDVRKKWPNNQVYPYEDETGVIPDPFFNPIDEPFTIKLQPAETTGHTLEFEAEVVGILQGQGSRSYETLNTIFVDVRDLRRLTEEYRKENNIKTDRNDTSLTAYNEAKVKAVSIYEVTEIQEAIDEEFGFGTNSMQEWRERMQEQARQTQMVLGALGAVSLLVAAISIANTMLMSVYERTREIGVMKVLGCLVSNIRAIFLIEAGLIGFVGGVLGIGISYLLSYVMNTFAAWLAPILNMPLYGDSAKLSVIPLWLVGLGVVFATLIGLVSGFYPANRAVRISALEAIKTE